MNMQKGICNSWLYSHTARTRAANPVNAVYAVVIPHFIGGLPSRQLCVHINSCYRA